MKLLIALVIAAPAVGFLGFTEDGRRLLNALGFTTNNDCTAGCSGN